jgi:thiol-disulfide isomerase/thioredoxin
VIRRRPGMIRRRRVAAALAATALCVGGLTACSSSSAGGSGTNYVAGDGTITLVPPAKRQQPIDLRGTTLEGIPFDLAALRGKTVVLNVWGSWCPPCRKEAPDLQAASVALKSKNVEFVGINVRDSDTAQSVAFQKTFAVTYPSVVDSGGELLLALRGAVAAQAIPSTLVLDAQGRIAARISSSTTKVTLVDLVDDVLAGKGSL